MRERVTWEGVWSGSKGGLSPGLAVVETVAKAAGDDPMELPPLYEAIDPTALDTLFTGSAPAPKRVEFAYYGYTVAVHQDGQITVWDQDAD